MTYKIRDTIRFEPSAIAPGGEGWIGDIRLRDGVRWYIVHMEARGYIYVHPNDVLGKVDVR